VLNHLQIIRSRPFVPEIVAEAGLQDHSVFCYCRVSGMHRAEYRRNCESSGGGSGPCYNTFRECSLEY
jgi:hypothetical protein